MSLVQSEIFTVFIPPELYGELSSFARQRRIVEDCLISNPLLAEDDPETIRDSSNFKHCIVSSFSFSRLVFDFSDYFSGLNTCILFHFALVTFFDVVERLKYFVTWLSIYVLPNVNPSSIPFSTCFVASAAVNG